MQNISSSALNTVKTRALASSWWVSEPAEYQFRVVSHSGPAVATDAMGPYRTREEARAMRAWCNRNRADL